MSKQRILMNSRKGKAFSEVWKEFITAKTAKGVLDMGAITQEEFEAKKKQLLGL